MILAAIPATSFSQLVVNPTQNITTIMNGLLGGGITYSNVAINCPTNAMGTFTANATNLGINNGVMLTTGACVNAIGPNSSPSTGTCNNTTFVDPQLTTIEPNAIFDFCMLEFDVVPQCTTLQIRFVFGSEEYPEWVSAGVNDAFGFFISGPGPACQPNFYNNTNVATLPNNVTPVSIDNVNSITNNAYYVDNTGGATIQYDGFTTVLTRTINVCPCQTYRFKIAIADGGDCIYDSGVFVDFFQCSAPIAPTATFTPSGCNCTGTATANATGGQPPYQYSWTPSNQTTQTITGLCPGTYTVWVKDAVSCSQYVPTTVVVTGSGGPSATASQQGTIACFGGSTGSAIVTPSGGNSPYIYLWTPSGQTTQTATGLSAGTYTVVVSDANGCTTQTTVVVTQPTQIAATATQQSQVSCFGGSNGTATANPSGGTPGYTYLWTPSGQTTQTATGLTAGTYTVVVNDANGCSTQTTVIVNQAAQLSVTQTQINILCNGLCTGIATATIGGGTSPYSYNWVPSGGTSPSATGLCAGTYTCNITDANGCTITSVFTITQPAAISLSASATSATCGQSNGSATANATGGTPNYTYSWAPNGGTNSTATGLSTGTYTVFVTDANGCSQQTIVNVPNSNGPNTTTSFQSTNQCFGNCNASILATASGGNPPYTYLWTPTNQTTATATGLCAGTYTILSTDANGCTSQTTITVTQPSAITATASSVSANCNQANGSATASPNGGTPGYSYQWAPNGGTNATATGLSAGTYTVTITDANGCTTTTTVTVNNSSGVTATVASQNNLLCNSLCTGTATANATGGTVPYTYNWSSGNQSTATATGLCAGMYTVLITDNNGCTSTSTVTITQPAAVGINTSVAPCTNQQDNAAAIAIANGGTPGYTYMWNTIPPQNSDTASALTPGSYAVIVTDANGCTATGQAIIDECPNDSISVPNVFTPNGDGINDFFIIHTEGYNKMEVNIFNRWGDLLYTYDAITGKWDGTYKGKTCSDGTYFFVGYGEKYNGEKTIEKGYVQLMTKR